MIKVGSFEWIEQALQWVHQHRLDFENPITTVNLSLGPNGIPSMYHNGPVWKMIGCAGSSRRSGHCFGRQQFPQIPNTRELSCRQRPCDCGSQHQRTWRNLVRSVNGSPASWRHQAKTSSAPSPTTSMIFNGVTDDFAAASGTICRRPISVARPCWSAKHATSRAYADYSPSDRRPPSTNGRPANRLRNRPSIRTNKPAPRSGEPHIDILPQEPSFPATQLQRLPRDSIWA